MNPAPLVIEKVLDAPVASVWRAITEKEAMKKWYFDLGEFIPRVGFTFRFYGETEDKKRYLHLCEIKEVIPLRKLSYSWQYENDAGYSLVTFELFEEGPKTRIRLTHTGLESFDAANPDFARKNFQEGWDHIIGISLKDYLAPMN